MMRPAATSIIFQPWKIFAHESQGDAFGITRMMESLYSLWQISSPGRFGSAQRPKFSLCSLWQIFFHDNHRIVTDLKHYSTFEFQYTQSGWLLLPGTIYWIQNCTCSFPFFFTVRGDAFCVWDYTLRTWSGSCQRRKTIVNYFFIEPLLTLSISVTAFCVLE